jgi:hypothetical protein
MGTVAKRTKNATGDVPEEIVRAAMAEPTLRGRVFLCSTRRVSLMHDGECVGFVSPHESKSGWRAGPIYVVPGHRGHKHVEDFYAQHPDRTWVAFIADENKASGAMHKRAGFVPWRKAKGGQWLRREASK